MPINTAQIAKSCSGLINGKDIAVSPQSDYPVLLDDCYPYQPMKNIVVLFTDIRQVLRHHDNNQLQEYLSLTNARLVRFPLSPASGEPEQYYRLY